VLEAAFSTVTGALDSSVVLWLLLLPDGTQVAPTEHKIRQKITRQYRHVPIPALTTYNSSIYHLANFFSAYTDY
jgi:hypothetical protein